MRLPKSVIVTILDIANREEPEVFLVDDRLNKVGAATVEEIMCFGDFHPFAKFFGVCSLKSTTNFVKVCPPYGDVAQVNTVYRCLHHFSVNYFKSVQRTVLSTSF